jgi:hypothetical protein
MSPKKMETGLAGWLVQNTSYVEARDAKLTRIAALQAAGLDAPAVAPVRFTQSTLRH